MAQGLQQSGPADWASLHPAVKAAELREEQISVINRRARLERDTPGPDPCAQHAPVGEIAKQLHCYTEIMLMLITSVYVCVSSSVRRWQS